MIHSQAGRELGSVESKTRRRSVELFENENIRRAHEFEMGTYDFMEPIEIKIKYPAYERPSDAWIFARHKELFPNFWPKSIYARVFCVFYAIAMFILASGIWH